jgi:hypothetical protein
MKPKIIFRLKISATTTTNNCADYLLVVVLLKTNKKVVFREFSLKVQNSFLKQKSFLKNEIRNGCFDLHRGGCSQMFFKEK